MLLTQDGILRSTAAVQMRWAEKNFATLEMFHDMWQYPKSGHWAIWPHEFWISLTSVSDPKDHDTVLHCPIPQLLYHDSGIYDEGKVMGKLRILMHFCDFLFPLFGATGSGLDKLSSRIPAVYRVNEFLKTRSINVCLCTISSVSFGNINIHKYTYNLHFMNLTFMI